MGLRRGTRCATTPTARDRGRGLTAGFDHRLLRLVSLVGFTEHAENKCGLRYPSDADRVRLTDAKQMAGHTMCTYYAGAVEHHQGDANHSAQLDHDQLPHFTLDFVTNLPAAAIDLVGEIVRYSLGLNTGRTNAAVVGRLWIEDVTATCWRLALADYEDRFGETT